MLATSPLAVMHDATSVTKPFSHYWFMPHDFAIGNGSFFNGITLPSNRNQRQIITTGFAVQSLFDHYLTLHLHVGRLKGSTAFRKGQLMYQNSCPSMPLFLAHFLPLRGKPIFSSYSANSMHINCTQHVENPGGTLERDVISVQYFKIILSTKSQSTN
mmetsp:Transcript_34514/g.72750  ORF Transcript_34514/g.72750 Transcript_34514/m.72750 type:complete len:158 (-) Transcript_34514:120-593(-)